MEADAAQFSAFVSYSHADAAIAKKLHRKIETYKLPKLLRAIGPGGKESGRSDGRLGQIFRDREDLPAALDLSESVKAALAQSRALIVLCSPHAKDSPWVAKEIELFRELHPDRPILAALIDGEPEEAFPPALLLGGEPLAADLRKSGDGWRLGLLKLVAGVAEVPLDALVQRDSQRHIRSVMTVTLVVGVALLAMIGMTAFAIQQRNAARHEQAQAEGLVEYMLTDLRTELKGVGRLDVMTDVNERAMDYYEAQGDLGGMSAESLERRARILHAMGEDDEKHGDLDKALAKFTEAHRVTGALLARDPDNADRIFGHAQSEFWVGSAAYWNKDRKTALVRFNEYKSLADRLVTIDKKNPKWLREAGYANGNLCSFYLAPPKQGKLALNYCTEALARVKVVASLHNDDLTLRMDLANRHAWLAEAYQSQGMVSEKKFHLLEFEKLATRNLDSAPENLDLKDMWITSQIGLAKSEVLEGKEHEAEDRVKSATRVIMGMTRLDPHNETWRSRAKELNGVLKISDN